LESSKEDSGDGPAKKVKKKPPLVEPDEEAAPEASPKPSPATSPSADRKHEDSRQSLAAPNATIGAETLTEYAGELSRVRKLIESALALTTQDLTYTYGSDDPANGGMDCSGFTYYVLRKNGFTNVPRDASSQYVWLRKADTFRAVLSDSSDTFELDDLRPGDLLFWIGTYATDHNPPVSHTMIYLGTEKGTKNRLMVGASDGRAYHGKSRWGVSVFDFHLNSSPRTSDTKPTTTRFVGYARPPGLRD
jgi:cell wall-associated NlpC family hydrolase